MPDTQENNATLPDVNDWANLTLEQRNLIIRDYYDKRKSLPENEVRDQYLADAEVAEKILMDYLNSIELVIGNENGHHLWIAHDQERIKETLARSWRKVGMMPHPAICRGEIERHKAGEIIEFSFVDPLPCAHCEVRSGFRLKGNTLLTHLYPQRDNPEPLPKCAIDAKNPYSVEIDIPSGEMVLANHLSPLFPRLDQYSKDVPYDYYSINHLGGRVRCTQWYAKHGYIEMNIGNCSCRMFQMNKARTEFTIGESESVNKPEVGSVCTDFWGYGIADHELAKKNGLAEMQKERPHMDFNIVKCKPGRYRFSHRYHLCKEDGRDTFTNISRISDCLEIADSPAQSVK